MATRWAKVRAIVRFGAVAGTAVALVLSAGCQGGGTRSGGDGDSADANAAGSEPDLDSAELQEEETSTPAGVRPVDPRVTAAVNAYDTYLRVQAAALPARVRPFTDAVRRGDLAAARKNYAASRTSWERIQSIGFLLPQLDRSIDGRIDDFSSPADPAWTGWHRLEYILWSSNSTAGAAPFANRLDRDVLQLGRAVSGLMVTVPIMNTGIERLVEEAISEKLPGQEDRYAHTDLADLAGNIEGARAGYGFARPVLTARSPALAGQLDGQFAAVGRTLAKYVGAHAYQAYPALSVADRATLQSQLTVLAENLAELPSIVR